jgi:ribonuclease VapC
LIVDTSAILAILRGEPDGDAFADAIAEAASPLMSAGTYLECAIVVDSNRDPVLSGRFDDLITVAGIEIEPVTQRHTEIARQAYRVFGKGSGHPAALNSGDCFAYALSRAKGEPLLFKGEDFSKTDVESALTARNPR